MVRESLLEILFWGDLLAFLVDKLESEVSNDPHERWEILGIFFRVDVILIKSRALDLDMLGQINNQGEVLEGVLIDRTNRVIDEVG